MYYYYISFCAHGAASGWLRSFFSYFPFRGGVSRTGGQAEAIEELGLDDGEDGYDSTLPSEPVVEDGLDLEAKGELLLRK